jgi:trk system potassium uptake protein TrkH
VLRKPTARDLKAIGYYTGQVIVWFGLLMLIPVAIALVQREWQPALDFLASFGICLSVGFGLQLLWRGHPPDLSWTQGMVAAALSWLLALLLGAIPYYLSGYYLSFLDAAFDVMSGFTTTGLTLIQDLNHVPDSINTWRMFISWLGGQGMVVLALSFLVRGLPGAYKIYVGEGKDERLLPNVIHTARAIWVVSIVYFLLGTAVQWVIGLTLGLAPGRSLLHAAWLFMAGWSTGGFAPNPQNVLYYHSLSYELCLIIFFVIGSFNFNLHWSVMTGNRKEIFRNLETVTFVIATTVLAAIATWDLRWTGTYGDTLSLFRKGYFQLISAHTTTGFMTVYARAFILEWGPLAMVAMIVAMAFGGSASSTAGGFKMARVGIFFKALGHDIKRLLLPESSVSVQKFHMFRSVILDDRMARSAMTIIILYTLTLGVGTAVGTASGYDFLSALFESVSVTGNVGLSAGVTTAATPAVLKVAYIIMMWLGRLEFMSVFVLFGYAYAGVRGR